MQMTVADIAAKIGGRLEGDGKTVITALAGLEEANAGEITFLSNPRYASAVAATKASVVVVSETWAGTAPCAVIRVKNADAAFSAIADILKPPIAAPEPGIHSTAVIADDASLGAGVSVGPYCIVESGVQVGDRTVLLAGCYLGQGTVVGRDCRFYPHVSTREYTRIGNRVIIHNGAVIGSDGFGYSKDGNTWKKIQQVGIVEIGDDVEIGANTTIDRARFGKTVISKGVKIDNLVQIAHNVKIGENTAVAAQVGISGSTIVGAGVQLGGQSGVAGHLKIGDNAAVGGQGGVTKDVPAATFVSGYPAMAHDKAARIHAHIMRLPDMKQNISDIKKRLESLENVNIKDSKR